MAHQKKGGGSFYYPRPSLFRSFDRVVFIATEGQTEYDYFCHLGKKLRESQSRIRLEMVRPDKKSAPLHVVGRLKDHLKKKNNPQYECWVVIDRDNRPDDQIEEAKKKLKKDCNGEMVISDPCFEYWLLLHTTQHSKTPMTSKAARDFLKDSWSYKDSWSDYDKTIKETFFDQHLYKTIHQAIKRAKERKVPPLTEVYRLVERLITPP